MAEATFKPGDVVRSRGRIGVVVSVMDSAAEGPPKWDLCVDVASRRWGSWRVEGICIWKAGSTVIADDDETIKLVTRLGLRGLESI